MKKKNKSVSVCKYCSSFHKAKRLSLEVDEDDRSKLSSFRKCPVTLKPVGEEDPSCSKFELNLFFWCKKSDQWVHVNACKSRRKKEEEGCVRCVQGTHVQSLIKEG